jgi:hypothetical protein
MPSKWPKEVTFKEIVLSVNERTCRECGSELSICCHREHRIYTLEGPLKLICKQAHCSNKGCTSRSTLINPESELTITMPRWRVDWDLFTWMGFRRFKRHWSVTQVQDELLDSYQINLSEDAITDYLRRYQVMVAARHQDLERWRDEYKECLGVILAIDGLQPEKGHETLYVVRELRKERVWFAEPLISSSNAEIRKLIQRAKDLAQQLGKPILGWISDKQDAFVTSIAEECSNVPHRYCSNHFIRDLAKPVLEKDSHAKVQMRRKVRGLRPLEKETLAELDQYHPEEEKLTHEQQKYAANIVLDYCAAVRGILNDNHGWPLNPPGLRMAKALEEVSQSIGHNLNNGKTPIYSKLNRLQSCINRGLSIYQKDKIEIEEYVMEIEKVFNTLDSGKGTVKSRLSEFKGLQGQLADTHDLVKNHMSEIMHSFEVGLFVGDDELEMPQDNLDLERWFKKPKGHERKIHGRKHVGMRIVNEGPTLLPALDAHLIQSKPFTYRDLLPYAYIEPPESQIRSVEHKRVMTKASSKKKDHTYYKI